jgi:hypothetical protein
LLDVFLYGLFMDAQLLHDRGIQPVDSRLAAVAGFVLWKRIARSQCSPWLGMALRWPRYATICRKPHQQLSTTLDMPPSSGLLRRGLAYGTITSHPSSEAAGLTTAV